MTETSWKPEERSSITYSFPNGMTWNVVNEYQIETCRHCGREQFCRLTHIWYVDPGGHQRVLAYQP